MMAGRQISQLGCALQTRAADPKLRHEVTEVLDAAQKTDLAVVRTWAFCESPSA